jgi:hypothetical protein
MKLEFEQGRITIQAIPSGRTVASAVVKSYLGRVKPDDSDILSTKTETTSELIHGNSMSSNYVVSVFFDRPTTAAYINAKHSIVITFTLDAAGGGGTHSAFFYMVDVI